MGCLLEVGQLLLGKLALAAGFHYQRLVYKFNMLDGAARGELLLKGFDGVGQGDLLQGLIMEVVRIAGSGYADVVQARKIERNLFGTKRRGSGSQRYVILGHGGRACLLGRWLAGWLSRGVEGRCWT